MGTRWRGLLAPINQPTGDGRRMAKGAFTNRPLPLPLKWQRTDHDGHDNSVVIGMMDTCTIDEAAGTVTGEGELFDDADADTMPRLAEDVAEALLLTSKGVIGPSVDAGAAEAVLVEVGSDEPLTEDRLDELLMEAWDSGVDPPIEMLFVRYEIAAATLVAIPAFAEARPFELVGAALTAAVRADGWDTLALAPPDTAWNEDDAEARMADDCGLNGDTPDWACYAGGFLYVDDAADPATADAYAFSIVDIIDGTRVIVPAAVMECATELMAMMGPAPTDSPPPPGAARLAATPPPGDAPDGGPDDPGGTIPQADMDAMMTVLDGLYERMASEFNDPTIVAPWAGMAAAAAMAALTASVRRAPAHLFTDPGLTEYTELTRQPLGGGLVRVYGHLAPHGVCHAGIRDHCETAPLSATDYALFHRYAVDTSDGMLACGRITTGLGKVGTGCRHRLCRGKEDHACNFATLAETIRHHDKLTTLAWVRAGSDIHGQWVAGVEAEGLTTEAQAVLGRRRVSGDWREAGLNLELVELLALAVEEPAFPAPTITIRNGRQVSLTASFRPRKAKTKANAAATLDPARFAADVADLVVLRLRAAGMTAAAQVHTGAMVAFRMTDDDAAALAIDGGEPAEELHTTACYLGEATNLPPDAQQAIIDAMTALGAQLAPITGKVTSATLFNPADDDKQTAAVVGVEGADLDAAHTTVMDAMTVCCPTMPEQHSPWVAHVTLQYTDDPAVVTELADRTNTDITYDRIRVAFAGQITDIALTGQVTTDPVTAAAALAAQVNAVLDSVAAGERAHAAATLLKELELTHV